MGAIVHEGECFCGEVGFTVTGDAVLMGYCHCADCRTWSASPVNAFTLWSPDQVQVTRGEDRIATYHKTDRTHRQFCTACGGHLFSRHPEWNLVDVFADVIPTLDFRPQLHVNYQETVLRMRDGLPKQRDFPKEVGGSGELIGE